VLILRSDGAAAGGVQGEECCAVLARFRVGAAIKNKKKKAPSGEPLGACDELRPCPQLDLYLCANTARIVG